MPCMQTSHVAKVGKKTRQKIGIIKTVHVSCIIFYMRNCTLVGKREKCAHIRAGSTGHHQTGLIVGINCVRTRQELISISYNLLYWTMRILAI